MEIADRCVVSIHYTLTNEGGEILDSSQGSDALAYLHGSGNIIPGLESALVGKQAGDKLQVRVEPAQGYGERNEQLIQQVPRRAFQGINDVKEGMRFQTQGPNGPTSVMVTRVAGDMVTVDGNHPLAGQTLNFDVEIAEVREASEEELQHGHVHGPGGHHH
ncbi:FKBP-type peptidyl-prolyl cis-trans isomerase [Panacagrimonas sp.]|uniref:FKBP-type peptidyl-prolyl cis-trans isomerase n=1 Tax=Panacagrimonas sp. TaxID=2480088 RepID=UPI003B51BCEF